MKIVHREFYSAGIVHFAEYRRKNEHNPAKNRKIFLDDKAFNLVKLINSADSGFLARTASMVFG